MSKSFIDIHLYKIECGLNGRWRVAFKRKRKRHLFDKNRWFDAATIVKAYDIPIMMPSSHSKEDAQEVLEKICDHIRKIEVDVGDVEVADLKEFYTISKL